MAEAERDMTMTGEPTVPMGTDAASRAARRTWRERLNSRESRALLIGSLATLSGGACWGFSGTCVSYLFQGYRVDPFWLLSVRQVLAGALFVALALATDRKRLVRLWTCPRDRRVMLACAATGLLGNQLFYLVTIDLTNAGTATVLQGLQLIVIMAYTCLHGRRAPKPRELAGLALALVGTVLIATGGDLGTLQIPPAGLVCGLVNAVAAALLTIIPARILGEYGSASVTGSMMLLSGIVTSAFVHPWASVPAFDAMGWAAMGVLVAVGSFLAFLLFMHGVGAIGSMRAGLLGTIEPISATVTSALLLGTVFTGPDLAGFAMIIAMMFLTT